MSGVFWLLSGLIINPPGKRCSIEHFAYCKGPEEVGLKYETIDLKTEDGVDIKGWFIESEGSDRAVIIVHGHGSSWFEGIRYSKALHDAGINLFLINMRGNSGHPTKGYFTMGYHEQKDVKAGISFLLKEKNIQHLGIYGFSMGGATSIVRMADDKRIKAGAFNSAFNSPVLQIGEEASRKYYLPYFPSVWATKSIAEYRTGSDFDKVNVLTSISMISPRPVMIMHSYGDGRIGIDQAKSIFAAAKEPKEKWFPDYPGHARLWNGNNKLAEQKVTDFFIRHLK